jgi:hypothetical protein
VVIVPDAAEYALDAASIEENPACHTQMRLLVPLPRELLTDPSLFLARPDLADNYHHDHDDGDCLSLGGGEPREGSRGQCVPCSWRRPGLCCFLLLLVLVPGPRSWRRWRSRYERMNYMLRLYACL